MLHGRAPDAAGPTRSSARAQVIRTRAAAGTDGPGGDGWAAGLAAGGPSDHLARPDRPSDSRDPIDYLRMLAITYEPSVIRTLAGVEKMCRPDSMPTSETNMDMDTVAARYRWWSW